MTAESETSRGELPFSGVQGAKGPVTQGPEKAYNGKRPVRRAVTPVTAVCRKGRRMGGRKL